MQSKTIFIPTWTIMTATAMHKYLKKAVSNALIGIAVATFGLMYGCAPVGERLGDRFNEYHRTWVYLPECAGEIDEVITVRVRGFCSEDAKQAAWHEAWPQFGQCAAGQAVYSKMPEIWVDLRGDGHGRLTWNHVIAGHELAHIANRKNNVVLNPDHIIFVKD